MTNHAGEGTLPPSGPVAPRGPAREAPVALGVAAGVLALGVTLLQVATAVAAVPAAREFRDAVRGGGSPGDVLTWYDGLGVLLILALVATYVVTCLWLQVARANAEAISPGAPQRRARLWVWLGWWVPVVSLWFPFQVVRDVVGASRRSGGAPGLGLWWTAWLVWAFANRASGRIGGSSDADLVTALPAVEMIAAIALVVACARWCRILHWTTTQQRAALGG